MAVKKHRCKYCGEYKEHTIKINAGRFCDLDHASSWAIERRINDKIKEAKRNHAERKRLFNENDKSLRTRCAQTAFNAYIRERDNKKPCVSCGRHHQGQYHAGHYRSVGAHPELRFEELNCHRQCSVCNNHKSGNIAEYRIELIKRIGLEKVEWLEGPHKPKKLTCADLKEIELYYKAKLKELRDSTIS